MIARIFTPIIALLPLCCFAQFTITGKVLNKADKKPVENVSVFLSNATVGGTSTADGSFALSNVMPGKYDLVVTDIAFETYSEPVIIEGSNIKLPDIILSPQTRSLKEVTIKYHADPNREKYLNWFKEAFLGTSDRAWECKIMNPEMLDLSFDPKEKILTASSADFLIVLNNALGYRVKYLLTDFWMRDSLATKRVRYKGYSLFEPLKGSPEQEAAWQRAREEVYANSPMHFFRAAITDKLDENNFRVQKLEDVPNPLRLPDSLIEARIKYFKNSVNGNRDSLAYWTGQSKLPLTSTVLRKEVLHKRDIISQSGRINQYFLTCNNCGLIVAYKQNHHFHINDRKESLYSTDNTDNTFIRFNSPQVLVYGIGVLADPYDLGYTGVWGRYRMAELLPQDYEPLHSMELRTEAEKLLTRLDSFSRAHRYEKAYLQFDKPYYAAGDTMYFKAYTTMNERHLPSQISGLLHAELIDPKNKITQTIKLQLVNGIAWGDFALPDSLHRGNYRVRAWTQWMRNDQDQFFEKAIPVGSLRNGKIPENSTAKTVIGKPDLQFFPEGGTLIAGIRARVAFKAIGQDGLGINVKGVVLDNDNRQVAAFTSVHLGMGSFELLPEKEKTYHAELILTNGTKQEFALPQAEEKGIALSINNDSIPLAKVTIKASSTYFKENNGKDYTLLIYSGGIATTVNCTLDSMVTTLDVLKRKLFTGITRVTLFSPQNEPLCERLIFIQNFDQLTLNVATDKAAYTARDKVSIQLNARTRADSASVGHFSVSVTDEGKVSINENNETTILTHLLLTSDLKGYVEQPNYYFTDSVMNKLKDLDLVMLTHGYRRFEWKQVLSSDDKKAVAYAPERSISIQGKAESLFGKPLPKAKVSLISLDGKQFITDTADDKGYFKFDGLYFTDTVKYVLQAVSSKGSNNTKLTYSADKPPVINPLSPGSQNTDLDTMMHAYLDNNQKVQEQHAKLNLGKVRTLAEVKINDYHSSNILGPGHADQVLHEADFANTGGTMSTKLSGLLRGINIFNGVPYIRNLAMNIYLDYNQISSLDMVNPNDIETVEVLKFATASIYGINGGAGVVVLTSKTGGRRARDIASVGVLPVAVQGFYKSRTFYAPKYDASAMPNNRTDMRSTVYWQPELATDKNGNASFEFYNADGLGSYRVVVEGIDNKGNIGRQVYQYKVQ